MEKFFVYEEKKFDKIDSWSLFKSGHFVVQREERKKTMTCEKQDRCLTGFTTIEW